MAFQTQEFKELMARSLADHLGKPEPDAPQQIGPAQAKTEYQYKDVALLFPTELKKRDRWIVRTPDKFPFSPYEEDDHLGTIDPHDEKYQAEYDTALGALEETTRYSGLGFVFNYADGYTGVDFDNCVNAETREIRPDIKTIIDKVESYTEISPSGTGVHMIVKDWRFPLGPSGEQGGKVGKAEMYSGKRYFTVTGNHVAGTPLTVESRDLEWLYERVIKNREFVVAKTLNGAAESSESSCVVTKKTNLITTKYETLTKGTIIRGKETNSADFAIEDDNQILAYESQSSADYALLRLIADKLHTEDPEIIKSEFLKSPLGQRDKATRSDYLDRTIKKLLASPRLSRKQVMEANEDDGISIDRPKLLTEVGNARRLIEAHGRNIRYCFETDNWYFFNGRIWEMDRRSVHIQDLLKRMLIKIQADANQTIASIVGLDALLEQVTKNLQPKRGVTLTAEEYVILNKYRSVLPLLEWSKASESNQKIRGSVDQAKSEPGISVLKSAFDVNQMICNVENGTLVFTKDNVAFRKHLRDDLCTRMMPVKYDPSAECPQFEIFMLWMFPDEEVRDYVLTYLALCLTGQVVRAILILFGEGANGKSTLVKTMYGLFGKERDQYGTSVAFSTFAVGREESAGGARGDLIPLNGPRLVTASESNQSHTRLDMARIKELTGGDQTTARGVYASSVESFYAQCKIILLTNNLPKISDDSDGAWDRLKLVDCKSRVNDEEKDEGLADKLVGEGPGILNLLIRHLQGYLKSGFREPPSVRMATEAYRGSENHINRFVLEMCETGKETLKAPSSEFYVGYRNWANANGEDPESQKAFVQYLQRRFKIEPKHNREGNFLLGIKLKPAATTGSNAENASDEVISFN